MSTAPSAQIETGRYNAAEDRTALPLRGDTLLGVCEAVGRDLGFNPTWLRIAFASLLLWNPEAVVVAYLALGLVVALTHWIFPVETRPAKRAPAPVEQNREDKQEQEERLAA
jgi:phage shock protein PspC (stress-responsive transcriptional regulator)